MSETTNCPMPDDVCADCGYRCGAGAVGRATKAEVLARLDEAHVALVCAAEAMARRYGSSPQVQQICGAAALITHDWMPAIEAEPDRPDGCRDPACPGVV